MVVFKRRTTFRAKVVVIYAVYQPARMGVWKRKVT
jgi:hypothetical protein